MAAAAGAPVISWIYDQAVEETTRLIQKEASVVLPSAQEQKSIDVNCCSFVCSNQSFFFLGSDEQIQWSAVNLSLYDPAASSVTFTEPPCSDC